jgi:hypothetical protein
VEWLVTIASGADPRTVAEALAAIGASVDRNQTPIPLDQGEQVITVQAPEDLPSRARAVPGIIRVNPSSGLTLY